MKLNNALAALSTLTFVAAQTPSGFPVQITPKLNVAYGSTEFSNGNQLSLEAVTQEPILSSLDLRQNDPGIIILMDTDAGTGISRTTFLHWLATNVTRNSTVSSLVVPESASDLMYFPPSPPAGDYPHHYVFLLLEQPENFTLPANVAAGVTDPMARLGFDVQAFMADAGVTTALAANYMLIENTTVVPSTSAAASGASGSPIATPTASSAADSSSPAAATASVAGAPQILASGGMVAVLVTLFGLLPV